MQTERPKKFPSRSANGASIKQNFCSRPIQDSTNKERTCSTNMHNQLFVEDYGSLSQSLNKVNPTAEELLKFLPPKKPPSYTLGKYIVQDNDGSITIRVNSSAPLTIKSPPTLHSDGVNRFPLSPAPHIVKNKKDNKSYIIIVKQHSSTCYILCHPVDDINNFNERGIWNRYDNTACFSQAIYYQDIKGIGIINIIGKTPTTKLIQLTH